MKIIRSVKEMREFESNGSRAFVPTMGALHEGHLSLVRRAKEENNTVVVSIFVNPTQFLPGEDFTDYPRDEARDIKLLQELNVDVLFMPEISEIYEPNFSLNVSFPALGNCMCGLSRPGHFEGVVMVVAKLFNIVQPTSTYFGQKDYQQAIIIRQLIRDLNFPIEMNILPTVREKDGLAMSSRNAYLKSFERSRANNLYKILCEGKDLLRSGKVDANETKKYITNALEENDLDVEYVDLRNASDLSEARILSSGHYVLAASVNLGNTNLIDNVLVNV